MADQPPETVLSHPLPHPVDQHVGSRLRLGRKLRGVSQRILARALGLTFQQVQKYERGVNRVPASMLYGAARLLAVSIDWFYEGVEAEGGDLTAIGDRAFLMGAGLDVVDSSRSEAPSLQSFDTYGNCSLTVVGDTAFCTRGGFGVQSFDLTQP